MSESVRTYGRHSAVLLLILAGTVLCGPTCSSGPAPGPGDGANTDEDTADAVTTNNDPSDPLIMEVTGGEYGQTVTYIGTKDENGYYTGVTEFKYWPPGTNPTDTPYRVTLDGDGWPNAVYGPSGDQALLTYNGDVMTISYTPAGGQTSTETLTLPSGSRDSAKTAKTRKEVEMPAWWDWDDVPTDDVITIEYKLTLLEEHYDFGTQPDDTLMAGAQFTLQSPGQLVNVLENNGVYTFEVRHTVKNMQKAVSQFNDGLAATGIGMTVIGVTCSVIADVASVATLGPGGIFITKVLGYGSGAVALLIGGQSFYSQDYVYADALALNLGDQNVSIAIADSTGTTLYTAVYSYDVFDSTDPVMKADARDKHGLVEDALSLSGCAYLSSQLSLNQAAVSASPQDRDAQCKLAENKLLMIDAGCSVSFTEEDAESDYDEWCSDAPVITTDCDRSSFVAVEAHDPSVVENLHGRVCQQEIILRNTSTEPGYFYVFHYLAKNNYYSEDGQTGWYGPLTLQTGAQNKLYQQSVPDEGRFLVITKFIVIDPDCYAQLMATGSTAYDIDPSAIGVTEVSLPNACQD